MESREKRYLCRCWFDGEWICSVSTAREISEIYEQDREAGIYGDIEVWDISDIPVKISLLDMVIPILDQKEWMRREYEEYCESEYYGG